MEYFTDQNNLNKLDNISPDNKNSGPKASVMELFVTSIIRIKKLAQLVVDNPSKFVSYVVFISFLIGVMTFAVPSASRIVSFGGFHNLFKNSMPEFSVSNGNLNADKKFEMKLSNSYIIMDTTKDAFFVVVFENTGIYFALGKKNVKMVNYSHNGVRNSYTEIYSFKISEIFPDGFNNDTLVRLIPAFYIMLIISFLMIAFLSAFKYLLLSGLYIIYARSATQFSKLPMTLNNTFQLCFYAQTIAIILVKTNEAIGYVVYPVIASVIGVIITLAVISNAMKPHMPDIDEIINNL